MRDRGPEAAAAQPGVHSSGSAASSNGSRGGAPPAGPTQPQAARAAAPLRIYAAGQNGHGQCGVPPRNRRQVWGEYLSDPVDTPRAACGLQPPEGVEVAKIPCGSAYFLVLTTQGAVLHAGAGEEGQQGDGGADDTPHTEFSEVPLPCPAVDIAAGATHAAAALRSGAAVTWGSNDYGELGRESTPGVVEGVTEAERVYAAGRWPPVAPMIAASSAWVTPALSPGSSAWRR
eukprot:TRINITY_DN27685_c0_g2_i3.p2 TRINITY_DN27685_c0_g2~~TRINITY_DN27685_c0_g2_i3.p2  ORF type:complete len:260 (+),score=54.57 TRINITY_DN27685_c0_g2_i3:90-782(+)